MIVSNLPFVSVATDTVAVYAVENKNSKQATFSQIKNYVLQGYSENSLTNNGFTATLSSTATLTIPGILVLPPTGDILKNGESVLGPQGVSISIDGGNASSVFTSTDITFDGGGA
jgi:hypothetical protein